MHFATTWYALTRWQPDCKSAWVRSSFSCAHLSTCSPRFLTRKKKKGQTSRKTNEMMGSNNRAAPSYLPLDNTFDYAYAAQFGSRGVNFSRSTLLYTFSLAARPPCTRTSSNMQILPFLVDL